VRRVVVLETNEIPLAIYRWYADRRPDSAIAEVLGEHAGQTRLAEDLGDKYLYPSQSWASVSTGVPFQKHGIFWYADPKPAEFPLYWKQAVETRSVGVVGSLHASPMDDIKNLPGLKFCVPEVFSSGTETLPSSLQPLHEFSVQMTNANARAVTARSPIGSYAHGAVAAARARLRPDTIARLASTAALVAAGRQSGERLRTAHFDLMADVFERQLKHHDPDLTVFFTNHVAAAMHRYWFASFPEDWTDELYSAEWREAHINELPAAMDSLDRFVGRMLRLCRTTDRTLVMVSSMGQVGGEPQIETATDVFVVREPGEFFRSLSVRHPHEIRTAMVPQVAAAFENESAALQAHQELDELHVNEPGVSADRSGHVVTVSYHLPASSDGKVDYLGRVRRAHELGGEVIAVKEHRTGTHDPLGGLLCANSPTASLPTDPVDAFEFAPAVLILLGLSPAPHHQTPTFSL
jgi:hypothetical protein